MVKSNLGKRKSSGASLDATSASDDDDTSNRRRKSKKHINQALLTAALNSKTHLFKTGTDQGLNNDKISSLLARMKSKEGTAKTSNASEFDGMECKPDVKTPRQAVPSEKSPKIKKKKREVVSNSEDSDTQMKYKSLHHEIQIKTENEVNDNSDAGPSSRVGLNNIKNEVLSESNESDVESNAEQVVVVNQDNSSSFNYINGSSQESESDDGTKDASVNSVATSKTPGKSKGKSRSLPEGVHGGRQGGLLAKGKERVPSLNNSIMERYQQSTSKSNPNKFQVLQDIRLTPKTLEGRMKQICPGFKPIETTVQSDFSDLDELYLLRIPKNVDPKLLKKAEINLENECVINLGEDYILTPATKPPDPALVISADPKIVRFKNSLIMEKRTNSKKEPQVTVPEQSSVPLPSNLKIRHPLFGPNFQEKVKLSESAEKKLEEAIANLLRQEKKLKKKDRKNKHKQQEEEPVQEIFNLLNSHSFLPNNDRIKKETSDDSAFGSSSSFDKLVFKNKKDKPSSSIQRITQETEEQVHKKSKSKRENKDMEVEELKEATKKSKNKKEKRKSGSGVGREIELILDDEVDGLEEQSSSSKKKKAKASHGSSWPGEGIKKEAEEQSTIKLDSITSSKASKGTAFHSSFLSDVLSTPKFSPELSAIISDASTSSKKSKKKSKKDKRTDDEEEVTVKQEELISQLLNDVTVELSGSTKKGKKKKGRADSDLSETIKLEF
ncbi:hypothetical protein NQ315_011894 [Exocentrus adspersus]|uniref:Uncharacterized protein n=1 Tax=Exocentrus adspersus TaxID=1586481 RepID=A0AAV8W0R3_9CUCU|nr:hypothetical protein NQ315_011894 [Exocentrus adspersus]